jgi:hypothetical protein
MDQKLLEEFQKELSKSKVELDKSKYEIIDQIKSWDKEEIFKKEEVKKLTIWQRIKKVLGF